MYATCSSKNSMLYNCAAKLSITRNGITDNVVSVINIHFYFIFFLILLAFLSSTRKHKSGQLDHCVTNLHFNGTQLNKNIKQKIFSGPTTA